MPKPVHKSFWILSLVLSLLLLSLPVTASIQRESRAFIDTQPAAGKYLVASESIRDPRFRRTVILLINHDEQGSLGLIVNRPSGVPLSEAIDGAASQRLYFGGPVQTQVLSMLFRSAKNAAPPADDAEYESMPILDDVEFVLGVPAVTDHYPKLDEDDARRVYAGYAGWSAGQLGEEIDSGGWHLITESSDLVFSEHPEDLWENLMRTLRGQWI